MPFFPFQQIKYTILKNGNRITSGIVDLCAELKKGAKELSTSLVSFGLEKQCPIKKVVVFCISIIFIECWRWHWTIDSNVWNSILDA